jgi:hypothetical protein
MEKTIDSHAKNLYKEMFLKYIRLAKFNNDFYVKTECRAQMKRAVTYKVDIVHVSSVIISPFIEKL